VEDFLFEAGGFVGGQPLLGKLELFDPFIDVGKIQFILADFQ
jgi:hypothetical protein